MGAQDVIACLRVIDSTRATCYFLASFTGEHTFDTRQFLTDCPDRARQDRAAVKIQEIAGALGDCRSRACRPDRRLAATRLSMKLRHSARFPKPLAWVCVSIRLVRRNRPSPCVTDFDHCLPHPT